VGIPARRRKLLLVTILKIGLHTHALINRKVVTKRKKSKKKRVKINATARERNVAGKVEKGRGEGNGKFLRNFLHLRAIWECCSKTGEEGGTLMGHKSHGKE